MSVLQSVCVHTQGECRSREQWPNTRLALQVGAAQGASAPRDTSRLQMQKRKLPSLRTWVDTTPGTRW